MSTILKGVKVSDIVPSEDGKTATCTIEFDLPEGMDRNRFDAQHVLFYGPKGESAGPYLHCYTQSTETGGTRLCFEQDAELIVDGVRETFVVEAAYINAGLDLKTTPGLPRADCEFGASRVIFPWKPKGEYKKTYCVQPVPSGQIYRATVDHVAGQSFADDLALGLWEETTGTVGVLAFGETPEGGGVALYPWTQMPGGVRIGSRKLPLREVSVAEYDVADSFRKIFARIDQLEKAKS